MDSVHRAAFVDALVKRIDPARTHFNKRCARLTSDGDVTTVHFQDGTTFEADVVLGADGIKSVVRNFVLGGTDKRLAYSNTIAYRGLIPYAKLKAAGFKMDLSDHPLCLCGPSKVGPALPLVRRGST